MYKVPHAPIRFLGNQTWTSLCWCNFQPIISSFPFVDTISVGLGDHLHLLIVSISAHLSSHWVQNHLRQHFLPNHLRQHFLQHLYLLYVAIHILSEPWGALYVLPSNHTLLYCIALYRQQNYNVRHYIWIEIHWIALHYHIGSPKNFIAIYCVALQLHSIVILLHCIVSIVSECVALGGRLSVIMTGAKSSWGQSEGELPSGPTQALLDNNIASRL